MNNCRYLISLIVIVTISVVFVVGQNFADRRTKLKFRPPPEWFANMQPFEEQSPSYFEQSDQPASDNQFIDLYVDDYEPDSESEFSGGSKVPRHPSMQPPVYQSLCPTTRTDVFLNNDFDYEYRPSSYVEVKCAFPFGKNAVMHQKNKVCGHQGFSCIQLNRTVFLTRRPYGSQSDCWEVETRVIHSACECMWPKHHKGDILRLH